MSANLNEEVSPPKTEETIFPPVVLRIFEDFKKRGREIYLIGPRAREYTLTHSIKNVSSFDITVETGIEEIIEFFRNTFNLEPTEEKKERKIITFDIPVEDEEKKTIKINIGPFRDYLPPLSVLKGQKLSGIILDLATREITIQAFAYDMYGNLIDPFGGIEDLQNKIIRPVFPLNNLFKESGGWHLKIPRYISRYGFQPHPDVIKIAERDATSIFDVPREFWANEMEKILCGQYADLAIQYMFNTKVLSLILPEVALLVGFSDNCSVHHKDLWEHTKNVIINAEQNMIIRWAALCHDTGKVWTRIINKDGKVHFFRHEDMSGMLFEGIAKRFNLDPEKAERILYIIKHHSRINLYRKDWTDSAIRRLIKDSGEHLDDLITFSRADLTSKREEKVEKIREQLTELQIRILEVKEKDGYVSPLRKGFGNLIMQRFNLPEDEIIGRLKNIIIEAIEKGELQRALPDEEYLKYIEKFVEKERFEHSDEL